MTYILIVLGLVLLFAGGELLVRGAVDIAKKLGVSTLLIGVVLIGFGTSSPELVTSIIAAINDQPGIAVGNVVGSNTANVLLILGLAALISPVVCAREPLKRDGLFMALASVFAIVVAMTGYMNLVVGLGFVAMLIAYIVISILMERSALKARNNNAETVPIELVSVFKDGGIFIIGLMLTFVGAHFLVKGSIDLARVFGVSETIIGLTIVAIGTSLPELVTSCMAALKKQNDIAFGNIVGSNIYNIFGILGVTAIIHPFEVPVQIIHFDIWVMALASLLLLVISYFAGRISRVSGVLFLILYVAYMLFLVLQV